MPMKDEDERCVKHDRPTHTKRIPSTPGGVAGVTGGTVCLISTVCNYIAMKTIKIDQFGVIRHFGMG